MQIFNGVALEWFKRDRRWNVTVDISNQQKPQNANHQAFHNSASDNVAIVTLAMRQELKVAVSINELA